MKKILIIDDDTYICTLLENFLEDKGFSTTISTEGLSAKKAILDNKYDLILSDFRLPDSDGMDILEFVKNKSPETPVIIMTAYADVKSAVKLIKAGAKDYVTKPIYPEEILNTINKLTKEKPENKQQSSDTIDDFIIGNDPRFNKIMEQVRLVAPTDMTTLIEGETGSGKEYIARAIHNYSKRCGKPFISVDCGAIPKELANSELFGHIKGAFTGAIKDKTGYFEQANGGTLFLDEIGNLSLENQIKMLRALQERRITKVGDNKNIKVDLRIIVATNEDLFEGVKEGRFREDLYHRVNTFKINIPPLRDRNEDILIFADQFINEANAELDRNVKGLDEDVKKIFLKYPWHGNIRELLNVIQRSVLLAKSDLITLDCLPDEIKFHDHQAYTTENAAIYSKDLKHASHIAEKEAIEKALFETNFNKSKAARLLNIDRKTLYNKLKQYNIDPN
jgi:two-component system response regulator HydG